MKFKVKPKRILCPDCKTGRESYIIDESSPVCPYLKCYNGYDCACYVPLSGKIVTREGETKKRGIIGKLTAIIKRSSN